MAWARAIYTLAKYLTPRVLYFASGLVAVLQEDGLAVHFMLGS
jgi:hypothetical protein